MKRPQWLTTGRVMTVTVLAVLIAVGYALSTGRLKSGIGADQTQTISEKTDKQGNIIEKTKTTTFQDEKTLWDWLSLLGVPFSLALLGFWFQSKQQQRIDDQKIIEQRWTEEQRAIEQRRAEEQAELERTIAAENRGEEALQTYFDRISTLLVEKNLLAIADKGDEATEEEKELLDVSVDIIRARTLSILRQLKNDKERKTSVMQFLIEAEVISKLKLNLRETDLSFADLSFADLSFADLNNAILSNANLSGADLSNANLSNANLSGAILSNANLSEADLNNAILSNANFSSAILRNTILSFADFSNTILSSANLSNANLNFTILSNVNLSNANLSNTNIRGAILWSTNLSNANLSNANLSNTNIRGAILWSTDLNGANLKGAYLNRTIFYEANLSGVNFNGAILLATDLREARELTKEQLEGEDAPLLCHVALPEGIAVDPDRDCEKLLKVLVERYPENFKTLEDAQKAVNDARDKKWD